MFDVRILVSNTSTEEFHSEHINALVKQFYPPKFWSLKLSKYSNIKTYFTMKISADSINLKKYS